MPVTFKKSQMKVTEGRYLVTLGVTFKVTAQTLVNTGFEGCCYLVTLFFINFENRRNREYSITPSVLNRLIRVIIRAK